MTTTQQERPVIVRVPSRTRHPGLMIGMVVIGLLIGLLGGWLIFGAEEVITVDGSALTDRQIEMVELIESNFAAWQDNDVDRVLSHYTERATFVAGGEYRVADGSLARFVTSFVGAPQMEPIGPEVLVDGNSAISFHTYQGTTYANIFHFTSSGDVLIARHQVTS